MSISLKRNIPVINLIYLAGTLLLLQHLLGRGNRMDNEKRKKCKFSHVIILGFRDTLYNANRKKYPYHYPNSGNSVSLNHDHNHDSQTWGLPNPLLSRWYQNTLGYFIKRIKQYFQFGDEAVHSLNTRCPINGYTALQHHYKSSFEAYKSDILKDRELKDI
ncbi:hypothetical protein BDA99DRAFT_538907 [Phascolomyces articulosus]|uniref:Uncharacterized protein n=1 Tax=Phascolomyces articulosus TaxID=60185 RepID=A0AAD5JXU2_9FUNG|nr:hypothetical protein BDA99DRAFT_538907 [Phascolomyces articulosus]